MILLQLAFEFFKIGLFAVGGGMATVPFLYELGQTSGWYSAQTLTDMIAVSECTPGAIGVNMATYVGFTSAGVAGGIVAGVSLIAPALIIASIISKFLHKFEESKLVKSAFYGLRPASLALILAGCYELARVVFVQSEAPLVLDSQAVIFAVILFILMKEIKLHPVFFLAFSALVGILLGL